MRSMRRKITEEFPDVLNHQLTQDILTEYEENGIDAARIRFYGELEKIRFRLEDECLIKLKEVVDEWD